jgi:hypothetical protein
MLADFQQAMADMVASPQLCQMVRRKPDTLWQRYNLSGIEHRRLVDMVNNPGMSGNCTLYRANRFAPILLHLPELSHALGAELRALLEEYWDQSPHTDVNFLIECERFCSFVAGKTARGWKMPAAAQQAFERERNSLQLRLMRNCTVL